VENQGRKTLRRRDLDRDPIRQLRRWLKEAEGAGVAPPHGVTLATANRQGQPAARVVLLRGLEERGPVFYSNYRSRKGEELAQNPQAALLFYWPELARQVRVEGRVELLTAAESDRYFAGRPRGNQLGAHASEQSRVIRDRAELEEAFAAALRLFADGEVPRPPHWGGYRLVAEVLEFWQEGADRLHDRLRYRRDNEKIWVIERLAP